MTDNFLNSIELVETMKKNHDDNTEDAGNPTDFSRLEQMYKNVAYYELLLSSWRVSRMEKDKQILILSTATLGFLMTVWLSVKETHLLYIGPLFALPLLLAIGIILWDFGRNGDFIELVVKEIDLKKDKSDVGVARLEPVTKKIECLEKSLAQTTKWVTRLFALGLLLTAFFVVFSKLDITISPR